MRSERWGHGQRWQAVWTENGRERSKAFPSRDGAEAHLARVRLNPASLIKPTTLAVYADGWLARQLHYAPSTVHAVRRRLATMILPTLGPRRLGTISRADVQQLAVEWVARGYAPATIHQAASFFTGIFAAALEDGQVRTNPCVGIKLPPVERHRIVPLTAEQVAHIANRVAGRYWSMVVVGAATGLRGAELRGLTVDRVVGSDVIVDRQLLAVNRGRPVFGLPKSNAGIRRVSLGRVASDALAWHRQNFPSELMVWTTRQHGPVDRKRAAEIWHHAIEDMGLPDRSGWHELRHHHASVLIRAGMSPRAVADRLGHADPAETLRTYAHLWPADHLAMTEAVDEALGGLAGGVVVPGPWLVREGEG